MKYKIGNNVLKGYDSFDIYKIIATKEDKTKHPLLQNGGDYVVQKIYDAKLNKEVEGDRPKIVFEEDLWIK